MYKRTGEKRMRRFKINDRSFSVIKSWHYLDNGNQYHYIHVFILKSGMESRRPIKHWSWVTTKDGVVIE